MGDAGELEYAEIMDDVNMDEKKRPGEPVDPAEPVQQTKQTQQQQSADPAGKVESIPEEEHSEETMAEPEPLPNVPEQLPLVAVPVKKHKGKLVAIICLSVLVALLAVAGALYFMDSRWQQADEIAPKVHFFDVDLSGMTQEEAEIAVDEAIIARQSESIRLFTDAHEWMYTAEELGLGDNSSEVVAAAYAIGRKGNIVDRYRARFFDEPQLDVGFKLDKTAMNTVLETVAADEGTTAQNAEFYITESGDIAIQEHVNGTGVDNEATVESIMAALNTPDATEVEVSITTDTEPDVTTGDLEAMQINGMLSSFSTEFREAEVDRSHNLRQACSYIDMQIVEPGVTFSFNDTVGERTTERDFRVAMIIEGGQFVPGLGGGCCQVSSTLYGAVLRTTMEVVERKCHGLRVTYVEPSQDAMIAWGSSDFKFTNTFDTPVLIHCYCDDGVITFNIYGNIEDKVDVELTSEVVRYIGYSTETKVDNSLAPGETVVRSGGGRGMESKLYRTVNRNGEEIINETVSHDTYRAQTRIVLVGPEAPAETET